MGFWKVATCALFLALAATVLAYAQSQQAAPNILDGLAALRPAPFTMFYHDSKTLLVDGQSGRVWMLGVSGNDPNQDRPYVFLEIPKVAGQPTLRRVPTTEELMRELRR